MVVEGKIGALGLSNYHAEEVSRAFTLCEEHGLTKPTVYQGLYNPLNRAAEDQLIPLLHAHGASFVAYNPLAAGLLTGAHSSAAAAVRVRRGPEFDLHSSRTMAGVVHRRRHYEFEEGRRRRRRAEQRVNAKQHLHRIPNSSKNSCCLPVYYAMKLRTTMSLFQEEIP